MKLIEEVVDYCLDRGMLSAEQLDNLRKLGVYYDDIPAPCEKLGVCVFDPEIKNVPHPAWEIWRPNCYFECFCPCDDCGGKVWQIARERQELIDRLTEEGEADRELEERAERRSDVRLAVRRKAGGGSRPVRKKTTAPELDALLAPLLDAMFADDALSRCVVKLGARAGIKETSNVRDAASSLARLSESELLTALTQAFDANGRDRLSLNDVYAAILAWPDLTFLKERGGPAVDACRTLLREDYELGVASRDAWLLGKSDAVRDLYWYRRFKRGLIAALRTVYETDKATFKRWSTDGGRLPFPGWDKANKTNTTCWRVWKAVDQTPREVLPDDWYMLFYKFYNDTETMALRHVLTDLWGRDWSHLTLVDGDYETFKYVACRLDYDDQPPLFPAIQSADVERWSEITIRYLKSLPNLQTLTLRDFNIWSDEWALLSSCANLRTLTLNNCWNETDAGLSLLSGCANLQTLELVNVKNVTDAGLSSLSGCANLQALTLGSLNNVTDAGLSSLSGCANLQTLELGKLSGVTDAGLSSLSGCANLQTLELGKLSGVTDVGLSSLSGCANLQTLELRELSGVTDAGLSSLSCCVILQTLKLWDLSGVTDAGLSSLSGCANLQTLKLGKLSGVTDVGLSSLSGCANLQTLELRELSGVTGAGLSSLLNLPNLRQIKASNCGFNGGRSLEITLDAEGNRRFDGTFGSDFVLKAFAQFGGDSLDLKGDAITDVGLSSLSGCANLQTLDLRELSGVTDAGLSSLSGCANLRTLEIWHCGVVTDFALTKLTALKGLRSLSLNKCGGFTGVGVAALGAASNLRSLEFWKCDGASSADVDALRKRLPNCEIRFAPRD